MITKIISGGQTGADQAGLRAAVNLGLKVGGTAPCGYKTENGPIPDFLVLCWGLREGEYDAKIYPKRTLRNILDSDGTVAFGNMGSYGEILTRNLCLKNKKPYIANPSQEAFLWWISTNNIQVLNVTGNRESVNPVIGEEVYKFLLSSLTPTLS